MSMKILELKVLYEMEEIAELREFADNFRRYVRKANKISQERQSLVVKLAGYVARLAEALPSEKEKLNKLLSQVEQEILPGKDWLINAIIAKIKGRKK